MIETRITKENDLIVVALPPAFSFYETGAQSLVKELSRLAASRADDGAAGVLLLQDGPASDVVESWIRELGRDVLLDELAERIEAFRHFLSLIRHASRPWLYAARDACFGSHFELAMTCQRRLWFSTRARLGFPEIASNAFPPGGLLETLNEITVKTRDRWRERPVIDAAFAMSKGRIHFAADAEEWRGLAKEVAVELLRARPRAGVGGFKREVSRAARNDKERSRLQAEIEAYGKEVLSQFSKLPTAWELAWHVIRRKSKGVDSRDVGRLISRFAARHFLGSEFHNWATARLSARDLDRPAPRPRRVLPTVFIDLDFMVPPTSLLERLLGAGASVVFVASEAKSLAGALDLVYGRLERRLGAPEAARLWERFVTWYQGTADGNAGCVLRWTIDDRLVIQAPEARLEIHRLEGNGRDAPPGLCEWSRTALPETREPTTPPVRIARLLSDGIVMTRSVGPTKLPLSIYVRSIFFEELLRISRYRDTDLGSVTDALRNAGWGFAASEEAWDAFLKTRYDTFPFEEELAELGARGVSREGWEIGNWKHARVVAKKRSAAKVRWNDTSISLHMAAFAGILTRLFARRKLVASQENANIVVSQALGFPSAYGTPVDFLKYYGRRRIEVYAAKHWPLVERALVWEEA